ncbi:CTD small phosphatase-like protein 2-B [Discoglossus pictus]
MILRSRKIPARPPKEPQTPGRSTCASPKTPLSAVRRQRGVQAKSPSVFSGTVRDVTMTPSSKKNIVRHVQHHKLSLEEEVALFGKNLGAYNQFPNENAFTKSEVPNLLKELLVSSGLDSPLRERSVRVHFQMDESSPSKSAVVTLYDPVFCFLNTRIGSSDCCCSIPCKETCRAPHLNIPYFSEIPPDTSEEPLNTSLFSCSVPPPCNQWQGRKEIPFKTRSAPENTLVLDLDDILIYSSLLPQSDADFSYLTQFQDSYYKVYLKLRPHAMEFLETLCKVFEIFVFTTAKRDYAERILEILDPHKKLIRHRLFQDHCICVDGHYVKDLTILQRDLAKTVALDTVPYTFPYQIANRIPVQRWTGNRKDRELLTLIPALEEMTHMEDVRLVSHRFHVRELVAED